MINQTKLNFTNEWTGWAFGLTLPNPGHGQSNKEELHQPMDCWSFGLTLPNPEYGRSDSADLHQPLDWLGVAVTQLMDQLGRWNSVI
jgi:hypothetical protein